MKLSQSLVLAIGAVQSAQASFSGNLNYESPSRRHVNLGVDVPLITRRSMKRGNVEYTPSQLNFTHGVSSGDPYADSVILWTRVAPSMASDESNTTVSGTVPLYNHDTEPYIKADAHPICVEWKVWKAAPIKCRQASPGNAVSSGTAYTTSDVDFTVKVEAGKLQPFTSYNYQFTVCGSNNTSPIGTTKTAPAPDANVDNLSLAVFSCSNYPNGYFNAYGNAARKGQMDYVVHLGDYLYESAGKGERAHIPAHYIFSLHDYRTRHGQYRTDPDLRLISQDYAWIATWDDHEVSNNGYRDGSSALNNTELSFRKDGLNISVDQRKMNAVRAYFEWMPVRQVDMDDNLRIWRNFQLGKLLDLTIIDTRNYDRSITSLGWNDGYVDLIRDEASRTLMGSRQEHWFYNTLSGSAQRGATWRIIGNQIIFSRIAEGSGKLSGDNWNGYQANRNRTLKHLYDNQIGNNVFLAGDSHQSWVSDLVWYGEKPYDSATGAGSIGVELAGTAVSSSGNTGNIVKARGDAQKLVEANPMLQWQDGYYRGYFLVKVTPEKIDAQYHGSPSVATRNPYDLPLANFTVRAGENKLARPVAGGQVEAGSLKGGKTVPTNVTYNTNTKGWEVIGFNKMYI
ncbi:PhoD-like phosphatase-domain-containing protein [Coniochaeta sp. 2T2.1]|nr:PhoD-like phosphatase-domain-containing protein [Coniochaeta sp. 2T2.1]